MSGFLNAIHLLADCQLASESQRQHMVQAAKQLKPQMMEAIESGRFDQARELLERAQNIEHELKQHDDDLVRSCQICYGILKPHSVNWYEGIHIDGCE